LPGVQQGGARCDSRRPISALLIGVRIARWLKSKGAEMFYDGLEDVR
jgi:hypothetical protein